MAAADWAPIGTEARAWAPIAISALAFVVSWLGYRRTGRSSEPTFDLIPTVYGPLNAVLVVENKSAHSLVIEEVRYAHGRILLRVNRDGGPIAREDKVEPRQLVEAGRSHQRPLLLEVPWTATDATVNVTVWRGGRRWRPRRVITIRGAAAQWR